MKRGVKGRFLLIATTVVLSAVFFLPSTPWFGSLPAWWQHYLPHKGITLGLDLQGGMHLVLEVDVAKAVDNMVERLAQDLGDRLKEQKIAANVTREGTTLAVALNDIKDREKVSILIAEHFGALSATDLRDQTLIVTLRSGEAERVQKAAVSQALETIRNRVDQFGVTEPLIQLQGERQILIQLPGEKNPQRALNLIGKTALLEFKLLDEENPFARELPERVPLSQEQALLAEWRPKIPQGDEILFERVDEKGVVTGKRPYLVKQRAVMTGDSLKDALVAIGDFNEPYVSLTFDSAGATQFERVTSENVKKRLAIVLDNSVYSAPVIQERIAGGRAQVSGRYSMEEANDLAIILRAGSLPAPVNVIQNVTVGPSLGQDSIDAGIRAAWVGTALVVLFMALYYRVAGVIADFALVLNVILLIGALAALNATLTLPGIAGIILTIGMSVDSNVLIFERIREELRLGKPVRLAVDGGYEKAFLTIVDSHVTTLITALVLFLFGTGPIKGFAVTLSLGVTINLFTALVGTKVVFDVLHARAKVAHISI
ncbi:MAG: protein translocase subunit SecD [Nitrospirae bacterium]|nr:protein translocase subunit SecD [Nitrospirota bacterium]